MKETTTRTNKQQRERRWQRWQVILWSLLGIVLVIVVAGVGYVGWTFSNSILVPQPYGLQAEFAIASSTPETVTLPLPPNANQYANTRKDGLFTLVWEGGTGMLGGILVEGPETLTRDFELLRGEAAPERRRSASGRLLVPWARPLECIWPALRRPVAQR